MPADDISAQINPFDVPRTKARGLLRVDIERRLYIPRPKGRGFTSTSLSVLIGVLNLSKENAAERIKKFVLFRRWDKLIALTSKSGKRKIWIFLLLAILT
jgi:hypothetical protein